VLLHVLNQLELGAGTVEVVARTVDFEIFITIEEIGEEAHSALKGDKLTCVGHELEFLLGHGTAEFFDKAPCELLEQVKTAPDLGKILFVLGSGVGAETEGIAVIVEHGTGHNGVEVDNADAFAGSVVYEYVVVFCVVVGNAYRNSAGLDSVENYAALFASGGDKCDVILDECASACLVSFNSCHKVVVAGDGIMEIGDSFIKLACREVGKHILKTTEGACCVVEVLGLFYCRIGTCAVNEGEYTEEAFIAVEVMGVAVFGTDDVEGLAKRIAAGSGDFFGEMLGDQADVVHNMLRLTENLVIELLQGVLAVLAGHKEGVVDVSVAERLDADEFVRHIKLREYLDDLAVVQN